MAVLSTLETCRSYDIYRNRETHQIDLRRRSRKALHHYFYFDDGKFGSVLRIETTLNDPKGLKVYRTKQSEPAASWHCCVRMA